MGGLDWVWQETDSMVATLMRGSFSCSGFFAWVIAELTRV